MRNRGIPLAGSATSWSALVLALLGTMGCVAKSNAPPYLASVEQEARVDALIAQIRAGRESTPTWEERIQLERVGAGAGVFIRRKLSMLFHDPDPRVRQRTLNFLPFHSWPGDAYTVELFRLLADPDEGVRTAVVARYQDTFGCSGDWLELAMNDPSAAVRAQATNRIEQLKQRPQPGLIQPLAASLESSRTFFAPGTPVTLKFHVKNISEVPQTLPAPAQVWFGESRLMREWLVGASTNLPVNDPITLSPGGEHVFSMPLSSLVRPRGEHLGKERGICTLEAAYITNAAKAALSASTFGTAPSLCRAAITIQCDQDIFAAFAQTVPAINSIEDPSPCKQLFRFIQPGDPVELVDRLFSRLGRPVETMPVANDHHRSYKRCYSLSRDYHIEVSYAGDGTQAVVAGQPALRRTRRSSPPKDVSPLDWVSAEAGLLLKIEPAEQTCRRGTQVRLQVTLRNLDQVSVPVEQPLTAYGKNETLQVTLCPDQGGWEMTSQWPSSLAEGQRIADLVRKRIITGHAYSFLVDDGARFVYISPAGGVTVTPCPANARRNPRAAETEPIALKPFEAVSFSLSLGTADAERPLDPALAPGIYRLALSYSKASGWVFSNTVTVRILDSDQAGTP